MTDFPEALTVKLEALPRRAGASAAVLVLVLVAGLLPLEIMGWLLRRRGGRFHRR